MAADPTDGDDYVRVADAAQLREQGRAVVAADGQAIALFHHEGELFAVDNRCPHMGFPLERGSVEDGVLTCHWHHARFELREGDTFDIWADDVQTFPVEARDGEVYVDPDPEPDVPPATRWRNRLADGLQENLPLVMAKAVLGLDSVAQRATEPRDGADGFYTPLETAVNFGTKYRAAGWGRGLTTMGAMANLYDELARPERKRAVFAGLASVADDCAGEPPRFQQYPLENRSLSTARLKSWFRDNCEVRDADGAERTLLTAVGSLPPADVAEVVLAAATDHLYMDRSHTLDFLNKAFETVEHLGWEDHAAPVLASTVEAITGATRMEERSAWRQPVDVASLCFDAHEALPELVAAGENREWERPEGFLETLLGDDPEAVVDALTDAVRAGATAEQLTDAVADAATLRVARFATSNEFSDWNTVHHTFSYATAARRMAARTDAVEAYRPAFDGAVSVYLDRFLNSPRAPLPEPGDADRDPAAVREELLACFDEQGQVDEAGRLVGEHFDAGGDPAALKRTLGEGLLREDAGFHTLQNVEAAFRRVADTPDPSMRRTALVATARYVAAHSPTRREAEQTFTIAEQLHRGEAVHE